MFSELTDRSKIVFKLVLHALSVPRRKMAELALMKARLFPEIARFDGARFLIGINISGI